MNNTMSTFGNLKLRLLNKLTESFAGESKNEVKDIIKTLKSNKVLAEMYLFYEDIENKYVPNKETATLFVEQVEKLLMERQSNIQDICNVLSEMVGDVETTSNELYECLDVLSEGNTLLNIETKVSSKQKLISFLMSNKPKQVEESLEHTSNMSLLNAVLVNNFNNKYSDFMNESEKEMFVKITSLSGKELENEITTLKEAISSKIDTILSESNDGDLSSKLSEVKNQLSETTNTKYEYYRLVQLKDGLEG